VKIQAIGKEKKVGNRQLAVGKEETENFASLRAYYRIVNAFAVNLTIMKITKYKIQITNKLQFQNYKLQTVGAKNFSPLLRAEKNADVQFSMTDNRLFSLTLTTNTNTRKETEKRGNEELRVPSRLLPHCKCLRG